jgi:glycosyltransferase involved in cell wall biosynthesis
MLLNPLVSIIVPNFNHEKYLKQRLESIFNQTYANFEVILLDDCSTDASVKILTEYAGKPQVSHCIFNETNSGNTFKQWAKGISLAKGDLIWIAESDDFCESNFLEKVIQPFQNDPDVVLAYCQSSRVNEISEVTGSWKTHTDDLDETLFLQNFTMESNEFIERFLIYRNVIPNASAVVFRKEAVDRIQHFDIAPEFRYCGDWMFYCKLISNHKVSFVHQSLNSFRYHSSSVIATAVKTENRISIIDIDYFMRKNIMKFLSEKKIYNFDGVKKINNQIIKELKYEKALIYIRNNNRIKGAFILVSIVDVFIKNYKFRKNIKIKRKNLFKSILK